MQPNSIYFAPYLSLCTISNSQHFRKTEGLIQKDANSVISTCKRPLCGHFQISGLSSFTSTHLLQQMLSVSFKGNITQDDKTSRKTGDSAKQSALWTSTWEMSALRYTCIFVPLHASLISRFAKARERERGHTKYCLRTEETYLNSSLEDNRKKKLCQSYPSFKIKAVAFQ